jgi:hypothetical protein
MNRHPDSLRDLRQRFEELHETARQIATGRDKVFAQVAEESDLKDQKNLLMWVRDNLRRGWDATNVRDREWRVFLIRYRTHWKLISGQRYELMKKHASWEELNELTNSVPRITPVEAALYHLQRIGQSRARHCPNPDCATPYFLAKKGQKYCSEVCALPFRLESKRRWWSENRGASSKPKRRKR